MKVLQPIIPFEAPGGQETYPYFWWKSLCFLFQKNDGNVELNFVCVAIKLAAFSFKLFYIQVQFFTIYEQTTGQKITKFLQKLLHINRAAPVQ